MEMTLKKIILFGSFSIDGLSASGLRVILHPVNKDGNPENFFRILWGSKDPTNKAWVNADLLYTYHKNHLVIKFVSYILNRIIPIVKLLDSIKK